MSALWGAVLFVLLFAVSLVTPPQAAYAESAIQATFDRGKREYESFTALQYFDECLPAFEWQTKTVINGQTTGDDWRGPRGDDYNVHYKLGSLVRKEADQTSGFLRCNKKSAAETFAKAAGYGSLSELMQEMYPYTTGNCDQPGHQNQCKAFSTSKSAMLDKIRTRIAAKGDGTTGELTAVGQFWYYNYAYRNSRCKGILTNTEADYIGHDARFRNQGNYQHVGSDGMLKEYKYALFKDPVQQIKQGDGITLLRNKIKDEVNSGAYEEYGKSAPETCVALAVSASTVARDFFAELGRAVEACVATGATDCRDAATDTSTPTEDEAVSGTQAKRTCESENTGFLGWLTCASMRIAVNTVSGIAGWFVDILNFDLVDNQKETLRSVWLGFRSLANVGFVIAFLVVIYSAATGNVFSAYDVKKLLPRVLIGAIGVQLSFFITTELLAMSNEAGKGISTLMLAPLGGTSGVTDIAVSAWNGAATSVGTVAVGIVAVIGLVIAALYSLGGILVMAIVFLLRNAAIIVLICLAPIAWVIPGKVSKKWWSLFIQLLLLYPLANAFLAVGQLIGAIWLGNTFDDTNFSADKIGSLVFGMMAIYAPYFLAPKMFGFAGSSIQGIAGAVDKAKAGTWNKALDSDTGQRLKKRAAAGELTKGNNRFTSGINTLGGAFANPGSRFSATKAGRLRSRTRAQNAYNQDVLKPDAEAATLAINEKFADASTKPQVQAKDIHGNLQYDATGKPVMESATRSMLRDEMSAARKRGDQAGMMAIAAKMVAMNEHGVLEEHTSAMLSSKNSNDVSMAQSLIGQNADALSKSSPQITKQAKHIAKARALAAAAGNPDDEKEIAKHIRDLSAIDAATSATGASIGAMSDSSAERLVQSLDEIAASGGANAADAAAARSTINTTAADAKTKEVGQNYSDKKKNLFP